MSEFNWQRTVAQGVILGLVAAGMFYLLYQAILHTLWREVGANGTIESNGRNGDGLGHEFGSSGQGEGESSGETG